MSETQIVTFLFRAKTKPVRTQDRLQQTRKVILYFTELLHHTYIIVIMEM